MIHRVLAFGAVIGIAAFAKADPVQAGCSVCMTFYDVRAGLHQFVGAREVRSCNSRVKAETLHVYGYVEAGDKKIFRTVLAGDAGFDSARRLGKACGERRVRQIKQELRRITEEATAKYSNTTYMIARQTASIALNTACAEEAERVRLSLARHGYAPGEPVIASPLNLPEAVPPPPPPPP